MRLLRFNLTTGAVSIAGNLLLMRLLVGEAHLQPIVANMSCIAACSLVNFLVSDRWVFSPARLSLTPQREIRSGQDSRRLPIPHCRNDSATPGGETEWAQ